MSDKKNNSSLSLSDFFFQWQLKFEDYLNNKSDYDVKTIENYINVVKFFTQFIIECGHDSKDTIEVNTDFILEYFQWRTLDAKRRLKKDLQESTKNNDKKILIIFFEYIEDKVEDEIKIKLKKRIPVAPTDYVEFNIKWKKVKFKKRNKEREHFDAHMVIKILEYLEKERKNKCDLHSNTLSFCFKLALFGGLRATEICNVRIKDFGKPYSSKENNEKFVKLTVYGKGGTIYTNPFGYDNIKNELNWFRRNFKDDEQIFFSKTGKELNRMILYRDFEKISNDLLLGKKGVHIVRHTFASRLNELGIDIRNIQLLMRHTDISTTSIYTAKNERALEKSLGNLDYK